MKISTNKTKMILEQSHIHKNMSKIIRKLYNKLKKEHLVRFRNKKKTLKIIIQKM